MQHCQARRARGTGRADADWVDHVPFPADHPLAARRREAEMRRPAARTRRVLLRYADGLADLITVEPIDRPAVDAPAPEWGLGTPGSTATGTVLLPSTMDTATARAALATTLQRYGDSTAVGLLDPDPEPADEHLPCQQPVFPLTLSVLDGHLRADFRHSHVSPEIAARFTRHLLGEPSTDPDLGRTAAPPVEPTTIHAAIARIAARQPDSTALSDRDTTVSYRELDDRSDRIAAALHARGVRPGDRVGICLDRSADLVISMLGILKAGAAYVPMDPSYPAARLETTTADAGLRVVISTVPDFPAPDPVAPRDLTGGTATPAGDPADAAYVIYTSGSTGRPKGVVVPHRNVLALMAATQGEYRLGPADAWSFFHSSAFDFSVWEIWGCLLTGGRLVVVPYETSRDPAAFADLLRAERVTVLSQTPSAFAGLLDEPGLPVRLVVFGGEPLDARMLLRWFDRYPESACRLVNMFGITETTVHVTAETMTRAHALAGSRSVGRPLPGWHVYVTDPGGGLAPPGVAGEICVGGAGVAAGYLGRPDLTADRFVPDPHGPGVLYRSGDRGRLRPDGTLEHLGRLDSQVKVRGHRIELDEIRAVLLADPAVRAAAVVLRHDDPADPATARLDAYVVPSEVDTASVRRHAAGILPGYMVPATVTPLDALPLTTNGKLDPTRLPLPARLAAPPTAPDRLPVRPDGPAGPGDVSGQPDGSAADSLVSTLAEVWSTVLGTPVGPDDDFFALGGNSLYAVRINAALRARGLPPVKLRDLFRNPTIRATAAGHREQGQNVRSGL